MKVKIYISGKITGIEEQAIEIFEKAEQDLLLKGYEPVNPMKLNHNHDKRWQSYMKEDIKELCNCEAIFMLSNWKKSEGAKIEHHLAMALGMEIIFEKQESFW